MYTYLTGIEANLYIGKNAGKKILERIRSATKSIRIMSPYLSAELVRILCDKHEQGVHIELITSSEITQAGKFTEILQQLVAQIQKTRPGRMAIRKWGLRVFLVGFLLCSAGCVRMAYAGSEYFFWGLMALASVFFLMICNGIRVYDYEYVPRFETKCIISPHAGGNPKSHSLVHAKLFVIDNETAFLGSLNYTWPGMRYNVESCFQVCSRDDVTDLVQMFLTLPEGLEQIDLESLAHKYYQEPAH